MCMYVCLYVLYNLAKRLETKKLNYRDPVISFMLMRMCFSVSIVINVTVLILLSAILIINT